MPGGRLSANGARSRTPRRAGRDARATRADRRRSGRDRPHRAGLDGVASSPQPWSRAVLSQSSRSPARMAVAAVRRPGMRERQRARMTHLALERLGEARHVGRRGCSASGRPRRGATRRCGGSRRPAVGIELRRRRRRDHEGAAVDVELAIRQPEGVAGEDGDRIEIDDGLVMQRMARRVRHSNARPASSNRCPSRVTTMRAAGDRHDLAVQTPVRSPRRRRRSIAAISFDGIDQVRRAARMQHRLRARQLAHQLRRRRRHGRGARA